MLLVATKSKDWPLSSHLVRSVQRIKHNVVTFNSYIFNRKEEAVVDGDLHPTVIKVNMRLNNDRKGK